MLPGVTTPRFHRNTYASKRESSRSRGRRGLLLFVKVSASVRTHLQQAYASLPKHLRALNLVFGIAISTSTAFLICIIVVVIIGALVAYRLQQGAVEDDGSTTEDDLRKDLERAYYMGEMDAEEFKRVSAALDAQKPGAKRLAMPAKPPTSVIEQPEPTIETTPAPETAPATETTTTNTAYAFGTMVVDTAQAQPPTSANPENPPEA